LTTTGELPLSGIPSGTCLAFLGYESYWPTNTATLTLYYTDNTSRAATFQVGSLTTAGGWTQLPGGDSLLALGAGGFVNTPDRVGTYGNSEITPGDGVPDVVLEFSDTGSLPDPVPEPAAMLLLGFGLVGLGMFSRKEFKKA